MKHDQSVRWDRGVTAEGCIPTHIEVSTKLYKEGARGYLLRDHAEYVLQQQKILEEGEHVQWNRINTWDSRVTGTLPDGRQVEFWFWEQREYLCSGEQGKWAFTTWHTVDKSPRVPQVESELKGQELIEYRFSGKLAA